MGKKKQTSKLDDYQSSVGWLWNLMAFLVVIGIVAQIFILIHQNWRVAEGIVYNYQHRNSRLNHQVGVTKYGLFKVNYDGDSSVQTWDVKVQLAKVKATAASQIGQQPVAGQTLNIWSSMCPPPCQEAVIFRARMYSEMRETNLILLAALALSAAIALTGVGCNIIMGRNVLILISCWVGAATISLVGIIYWLYDSDLAWSQIASKQQVPYPVVGSSFYIGLASIGIYILASCGIYIADSIDNYQKKSYMEKEIAQNLFNEQNLGKQNIYDGYQNPQSQIPGMSFNPFMGFGMPQQVSQSSVPNQTRLPPADNFGGLPYPNAYSSATDPRMYFGDPKQDPRAQGFGNFPR